MVTCKGCNKTFDYGDQPETSMGAVRCPLCNATVDQTGRVLKSGKRLPLKWYVIGAMLPLGMIAAIAPFCSNPTVHDVLLAVGLLGLTFQLGCILWHRQCVAKAREALIPKCEIPKCGMCGAPMVLIEPKHWTCKKCDGCSLMVI